MGLVVLNAVREDEDIVKVHMDEFSQMVSENIDHDALEGGGCIAVTLLHDDAHHCPVDNCECHLPHVFRYDTHLLVDIRQIDF